MSRVILNRNSKDIVSKIRRLDNSDTLKYSVGIILNDDGTVFDKMTKKRFSNIVEWSKECRNVV